MTASISLEVIGLFQLLFWSWFNFGKCYLQENNLFCLDFQFGGVQVFTIYPYDSLNFLGVCFMSSFSFLILLKFSLQLLVNSDKGLSILLIFQRIDSLLHSFFILFCCVCFYLFHPSLIIIMTFWVSFLLYALKLSDMLLSYYCEICSIFFWFRHLVLWTCLLEPPPCVS